MSLDILAETTLPSAKAGVVTEPAGTVPSGPARPAEASAGQFAGSASATFNKVRPWKRTASPGWYVSVALQSPLHLSPASPVAPVVPCGPRGPGIPIGPAGPCN